MTVGWRWHRVILATSLALFAAGMLPACQREPAPAPSKPSPALTGLPIMIALLPERNIFEQKKRYQPLQEYLSAAIGRPVAFKLLDSYQLIFAEIIEHRIDGAFFGSMNGAFAQIRGGVEMLAAPSISRAPLPTPVCYSRAAASPRTRGPGEDGAWPWSTK